MFENGNRLDEVLHEIFKEDESVIVRIIEVIKEVEKESKNT